MGMSPLAIGLFLVAFGTSLPEFFVSHLAALKGSPSIALGNVIGSNISNIFLIMGVSALFCPLSFVGGEAKSQLILHGLLMLSLAIILTIGRLNLWWSSILLGFYFYFLYNLFPRGKDGKKGESPDKKFPIRALAQFFLGIILLSVGGEFLVRSTIEIAQMMKIDEYVISAIFVALGTSLPELATALASCKRPNAGKLIVGNVIGSNIFNVSCVLGTLGVYNIAIEQNFILETITPALASFLFLFLAFKRIELAKKGGIIALLVYGIIVAYWIMG